MWETILVLVMVHLSREELTGSNVCHVEKRFIVNATEYFIRNSTVRNYQWCMNVPPRCSYYTLKQVNASRMVETEVQRAVPECCAGYEEKDNSCVQICPGCLHGECKDGKCDCHPGFQGDTCDRGCEPMKWGTNCKLNCTCERGTCLPITGNCICPSGWNGTECQHQCPEGSYGINCAEKCRCDQNELCHRITGECEKLPTTPLPTTTSSQTTTATSRSTTASTTNPPTTTTVQANTVIFKNNGKFKPNKQITLDNSTSSSENISDEIPFLVIDEQEKSIIPPSTSDDEDDDDDDDDVKKNGSEERGFYTKHPQVFKSSNEIVRATTGSLLEKENYLKDEAIRDEEKVDDPPPDKRDMVNGASAATAISVTLFVIVLAVIAAKSFKKKKEKAKQKEVAARTSNGVSKVSVYTHSIFHTPLPDPPPFENPVFTPATENGDGTRFETRVVCSMNFPVSQEKDPREYLYDHPPSTGSYRAVSIPEPSDIDNVSLAVQTFSVSEPVYDEIPTGMAPTPVSEPPPSYKSSSLYMNTCGKTRL